MKNFTHLLSTGFFSEKKNVSLLKTTLVEGLALDHVTRCPLEGVRVAVYLHSNEAGRLLIHEMVTDNNGYFSGFFQAEADTFSIAPSKENYSYYGTYSIADPGALPLECEEVKHGKNQFYTFVLETGVRRRVPAYSKEKVKVYFPAYAFSRVLASLPIFRFFFWR
jgi:hypothetical protein